VRSGPGPRQSMAAALYGNCTDTYPPRRVGLVLLECCRLIYCTFCSHSQPVRTSKPTRPRRDPSHAHVAPSSRFVMQGVLSFPSFPSFPAFPSPPLVLPSRHPVIPVSCHPGILSSCFLVPSSPHPLTSHPWSPHPRCARIAPSFPSSPRSHRHLDPLVRVPPPGRTVPSSPPFSFPHPPLAIPRPVVQSSPYCASSPILVVP
jgi:hypothetical protein